MAGIHQSTLSNSHSQDADAESKKKSPAQSSPAQLTEDLKKAQSLLKGVLEVIPWLAIEQGAPASAFGNRVNRKLEKSLKLYQQIASSPLVPNKVMSVEIQDGLGQCYWLSGDKDSAIVSFQLANQLATELGAKGTGNAIRSFRLARLLALSGKVEDSEKLITEAYAKYPRNFEVQSEYARVLLGKGKKDQAVALYLSWIKDQPKNWRLRTQLCSDILLRSGDIDLAYTQLLGLAEQALNEEEQKIVEPTLIMFARAIGPPQRFEDAIRLLHKVLEKTPSLELCRRELSFLLRHVNRPKEAEKTLREAAEVLSDPHYLLVLSTDILAHIGDFDGAKKLLEEVRLAKHSDEALVNELDQSYVLLAQSLGRAGKVDEAKALLADISQKEKTWGNVTFKLAQVHLAEKQSDKAIALCESFLATNPTNSHFRSLYGLSILSTLERKKEAVAQLEIAVKTNAADALVRSDYALALYLNDELDKAIGQMEYSVDLLPTNQLCVQRMVELLEHAKRMDEAQEWQARLHWLRQLEPLLRGY